ncbi:hypothetical protein [Pararhizobium sp. A13]|uniref:hypothetical protein n=1 Tax=Pararhizobium sp. A13 TaxID=3133975 RepID=UPI003246EA66
MFYHGGMTLGYLTPPAKPEKTVRAEEALRRNREETIAVEQERDQELSRAFLTPWHLFY